MSTMDIISNNIHDRVIRPPSSSSVCMKRSPQQSGTMEHLKQWSNGSNRPYTSYRFLLGAIRDTLPWCNGSSARYRPLSSSSAIVTKKITKSTKSSISDSTTPSPHLVVADDASMNSRNQSSSSFSSTLSNKHQSNVFSHRHYKIRHHSPLPYSVLSILFHLFLLPSILYQTASLVKAQQTCGYPGSPAHAIVTMSPQGSVVAGTVATYTCDNGYELLGPARRQCNENGTWTPLGIPFCVLNVAVGKAAMQSSSVGQGTAQKAIDGSTSTFYNPSTCSMTEAEPSPWFYVNLLEPVLVQLVRIDFGASCCGRNPATITVRVGNFRPDMGTNQVCNKFTGYIEEGRPLFLPCARPMPGAFVSVHLESNGNPLSICEMFVYTDHALSIEQCPSFRDQPLGSTSTYNGNCYIFYNHQPMTFTQSKLFCEKRGGSLVNQISPALQGFLSWELYRRHRNDKNGQYWLGVVRDPQQPNNWKWINGKDVTLSFWNLPGTQENCSRFDGTKGFLWSDTNCATKLNFMCQHRPLSCGKPERPVNSTVLATSTDVGATIEYRCGEGNLLMGPSIRTCLPNGFFSEFSPKCKFIECGFPASIGNGHYLLNNNSRSYQSSLTYHCKDGYVLVGRAHLVCDADARWNGPPPRCEPVLCPSPPMIVNGFYTLSGNSTMFGSLVEYNCDPGYQLIGERTIICNMAGYWEGQPGYCDQLTPSPPTTTTTTSTTTTQSPTMIQSTMPVSSFPTTTSAPTTFFSFNRGQQNSGNSLWSSNSVDPTTGSVQTKRPTIVLLPTVAPSSPNTIVSSSSSVQNSNPYTRGGGNGNGDGSSSSFSPNTTPTSTIGSTSTSTTKMTSSTRRQPFRPTTNRPSYPSIHLNEIPGANIQFDSKPSRHGPNVARLNMGGIIALGVFGGFVFLAAVITIIVIIIRRVKHNHSSLDAQTISTFDSSNGDNPGFYHKYASAWSQLQSSANVMHSGSYKPNLAARLDPYDAHQFHRRATNNNGTINEGFRDSNEITMNADVYARSSSGGSGGSGSSGGAGGGGGKRYNGKRGIDHEWQHLTRAKY